MYIKQRKRKLSKYSAEQFVGLNDFNDQQDRRKNKINK